MIVKILGLFASALVMSAAANAADLESGGSLKDEYAPVSTWSGFYLGLHAGIGDIDASVTDFDGTVFDAEGMEVSHNAIEGLFGVQIGYNKQFGSAVIGVEADYTLVDFDKGGFFDGDDQFYSAEISGFGTARAKLGLAVNNALVYVTGGVAFVDVKQIGADNFVDQVVRFDDWRLGLAAGVGTELKITDNLSLKAEYLYIGLEEDEARCADCDNGKQVTDVELHTLKVGVNYYLHKRQESLK